jgi:HAMP domain-containing protein
MPSLSIRWKLALAALACLGGTAAAVALVARANLQAAIAQEGEQAAKAAARGLATLEQREIERLSTALDALVHQPTLAALYLQRDRERLLAAAMPAFTELRARHHITHWSFLDPEPLRTCFLRVEQPDLHDDVVDRPTLRAAIKTDAVAAGKEVDQTGLALRVVRPYRPEGKLLGYVEVAEELEDFLGRLKAEQGDDYGLVLDKKFLDEKSFAESRRQRRNPWGDDPKVVLANATSGELSAAGVAEDLKELPDGGQYLEAVDREGRLFVRGLAPVRDAAGKRVGGLLVSREVTALRDRVAREQWRSGALFMLLALAQIAVLAALVELFVFRRMVRMTRTLEEVSTRLAGGDYGIGGTLRIESHDEIGRFEKFLGEFLATIGQTLTELEKRM